MIANARRVAQQVRESEPVLKDAVEKHGVKVVAADYALDSGKSESTRRATAGCQIVRRLIRPSEPIEGVACPRLHTCHHSFSGPQSFDRDGPPSGRTGHFSKGSGPGVVYTPGHRVSAIVRPDRDRGATLAVPLAGGPKGGLRFNILALDDATGVPDCQPSCRLWSFSQFRIDTIRFIAPAVLPPVLCKSRKNRRQDSGADVRRRRYKNKRNAFCTFRRGAAVAAAKPSVYWT